MKKCFITGLVIMLPAVLTVAIVLFFVNLLTNPFQGLTEHLLHTITPLDSSILFFSPKQIIPILSKILILCTLFFTTIAVGFFGQWVLMHKAFQFGELIIKKIPIISKVYQASQEVVQTLFSSKNYDFTRAALIPFPHKDAWSFAMVTGEHLPEESNINGDTFISVFLPATPNPTMGFMLMFKKDRLIPLDVPVEDILKLVISCGVIGPKNLKEKENA